MDTFTSKDFNPVQALANRNLKIEEGEEHENLHTLRSEAQEKGLKATPSDVEGVAGPGGFPLAKSLPHTHDQGRKIHQDQAPMFAPRKEKHLRNVLLRMDNMAGPLAVLRTCRDTHTKVKVYTRNHSEVRGILTGYVVAFDKYWNLVLRDVHEIFQKKIKSKTVSLQNVEKYVNVADLTITPTEEEYQYKTNFKGVWMNPFQHPSTQTRSGNRDTVEEFGDPCYSLNPQKSTRTDFESYSSKARGHPFGERIGHTSTTVPQEWHRDRGIERKTAEGVRIDKKTLKKNSSRLKDVTTLQFTRRIKMEEEDKEEEIKNKKEKRRHKHKEKSQEIKTNKDNELEEIYLKRDVLVKELKQLEESEENEDSEDKERIEENTRPKRRRRRKKHETRERHVKQLLIRGETVVLINVVRG